MGRNKTRKTRWRRLSIGSIPTSSSDEDEDLTQVSLVVRSLSLGSGISPRRKKNHLSSPVKLNTMAVATEPSVPNEINKDKSPPDDFERVNNKESNPASSYNHYRYGRYDNYDRYHYHRDNQQRSYYQQSYQKDYQQNYQQQQCYYGQSRGSYHRSYSNNGDYYGQRGSSSHYGRGFNNMRRSRSYPVNYQQDNTGVVNKPSFNQDEYTKITTPRQDVLFKKGYLSQKKTPISMDTPSSSNNGTPDSVGSGGGGGNSSSGINSDYSSSSYDNNGSETEGSGGVQHQQHYEQQQYYYADHTFLVDQMGQQQQGGQQQVFYGDFSFHPHHHDHNGPPPYPLMIPGCYPPTVYYPVPYPVDWNGVPVPYHQGGYQMQVEQQQEYGEVGRNNNESEESVEAEGKDLKRQEVVSAEEIKPNNPNQMIIHQNNRLQDKAEQRKNKVNSSYSQQQQRYNRGNNYQQGQVVYAGQPMYPPIPGASYVGFNGGDTSSTRKKRNKKKRNKQKVSREDESAGNEELINDEEQLTDETAAEISSAGNCSTSFLTNPEEKETTVAGEEITLMQIKREEEEINNIKGGMGDKENVESKKKEKGDFCDSRRLGNVGEELLSLERIDKKKESQQESPEQTSSSPICQKEQLPTDYLCHFKSLSSDDKSSEPSLTLAVSQWLKMQDRDIFVKLNEGEDDLSEDEIQKNAICNPCVVSNDEFSEPIRVAKKEDKACFNDELTLEEENFSEYYGVICDDISYSKFQGEGWGTVIDDGAISCDVNSSQEQVKKKKTVCQDEFFDSYPLPLYHPDVKFPQRRIIRKKLLHSNAVGEPVTICCSVQ